ncbi:MAG: hypothetical protein AAGC56_07480 [Pseudomonadota bacterium]
MKRLFAIGLSTLALMSCSGTPRYNFSRDYNVQPRNVAATTCETEADLGRKRYLDFLDGIKGQTPITQRILSGKIKTLRREIDYAHQTVITRCKTHIQCLEANSYMEAQCYMSASDRKDAERRFRDISDKLAVLEQELGLAEIDADTAVAGAAAQSAPTFNFDFDQRNRMSQDNEQINEVEQDVDQRQSARGSTSVHLERVCRRPEGMMRVECIRLACERDKSRCE